MCGADRDRAAPVGKSGWQGFLSIVWLGMYHIAEGTGHLLFLLTLLLPAPLLVRRVAHSWGPFGDTRRSLRNIVRLTTALGWLGDRVGWSNPLGVLADRLGAAGPWALLLLAVLATTAFV